MSWRENVCREARPAAGQEPIYNKECSAPLRPSALRALLQGLALPLLLTLTLVACTVSYKFTGTSINYDLIKTITIDNIPNRAPYGWAPMEAMFNNKLKDLYANQTRLRQVKRGGDLQIAGEITGYDQFNKSVSSDGFSSQVQLRMTVNIRFQNVKTNQSWERSFSATTLYNSTQQLSSVQEKLVTEMVADLTDQIFNATVADW